MRFGTAQDAAELLGMSVYKVRALAKTGELPIAFRGVGKAGRLRFDLDALVEWEPPAPTPAKGRYVKGFWVPSVAEIEKMPTIGWCYFIQCDHGGPVKIGQAGNVEARRRGLQAACPYKLVVLAEFAGGRQMEARLHRRFARYRLHGEWFDETAPGIQSMIREAA